MYIIWENKKTFKYPAELLRIESPSVEVQGYGGISIKKSI